MGAGRWYLAGLNAHRMVVQDPAMEKDFLDDVRQWTAIPGLADIGDQDPALLFACWSQVVFQLGGKLIVCGFRAGVIQDEVAAKIQYIVGDHNGMMGAVDTDGLFYIATTSEPDSHAPPIPEQSPVDCHTTPSCLRLVLVPQREDIRLLKVSVAGNFHVAVTHKQSPTDTHILVTEFRDLGHFKAWYCFSPSHSTPSNLLPTRQHRIPGKFKQLCTGNSIFACLNWSGQVYTWGDPRFRGLGRSTLDHPADEPGILTCFDPDEFIDWIGAGGNMFSALTMDGVVYVFSGVNGRRSPIGSGAGGDGGRTLAMHRDTEPGEKVMVAIEDEDGRPVDFNLMAVGNGHILLRSPGGRVYGAGENRNGQLGIADGRGFVPEWVEVVPRGCTAMRAGSKTSVMRAERDVDLSVSREKGRMDVVSRVWVED